MRDVKATDGVKVVGLSRAKTAWGLVQDAKRAIRRDPLVISMLCFMASESENEYKRPACGSVGCFAGQINWKAGIRYPGADDDATRNLLGPDVNYYTVKGSGGPEHTDNYVFNAGAGDRCSKTKPQTIAHARAVIARINRFLKVNEKALKARKLVRVGDHLAPVRG